jgi:hypothetical protein
MVNGEALEAVLMLLVLKINETTTGVVVVDRQFPPSDAGVLPVTALSPRAGSASNDPILTAGA